MMQPRANPRAPSPRTPSVYSFNRRVYDRALAKRQAIGIQTIIDIGIGEGGPAPVSSVNFANLFPGAFQVVQTNLGLTYGGTPLATAGNTSTTVLTLTGTLPTVPVPIWAVATNTLAIGSGATFNIYYDGLGVTPAMTGVTPAVATPVALTGAATGLSLQWAAGSSVNADSWKATCSGLADQSGNLLHYSQASASKQPVITVGLNGKVGLRGDGVDDSLVSLLNLPAPAVTPQTLLLVGRLITWTGNARPVGCTSAFNGPSSIRCLGASPAIEQVVSAGANSNSGGTLGSFWALTAYYSNSTSDQLRIGATVTSGASAGSSASTGHEIFSGANTLFCNFEFLAAVFVSGNVSDTAFRAAVNSAAGYGVGNVLV